jgi:hypothetical protein
MKPIPEKFLSSLRIFIIVELLLGAYLIMLAVLFKTPIPDIKQQLLDGYRFPYTNSCTVGDLVGMHIHLHLIIVMLVFLTFYSLGQRLPRPSFPTRLPSIPELLLTAGLALWASLIFLQTINHAHIFANERRIFSGKSVSEKQRFIHKQPYVFAQYCRRRFPGRHKGFLRTDLDPQDEPFATQHRKLVYFLFPDIDIRNIYVDAAYDCLIFYDEETRPGSIPPGFKIKGVFDARHVIAVKEEAP